MSKQTHTPLKKLDLAPFDKALNIVKTGKDEDGIIYNNYGMINQAAWIGENSGCLIREIETLRNEIYWLVYAFGHGKVAFMDTDQKQALTRLRPYHLDEQAKAKGHQ